MQQHSADTTDEFSFALGVARFGVGVFALHAIRRGVPLRLCGDDDAEISHVVREQDVPQQLLKYCIPVSEEEVIRPNDFSRMELIWYVNHAAEPNAGHVDFRYFALRDIEAGEEITIDYRTLGIPPPLRDDYFRDG